MNSASAISFHVLRRWRSSRIKSKCGSRILWNALPPRFGCAGSVINRQHNTTAANHAQEYLKVKWICVCGRLRQKAATAGVIRRQIPANFQSHCDNLRQIHCRLFPLFAATFRTVFSPNDFVRRWCLEKIKAFKF